MQFTCEVCVHTLSANPTYRGGETEPFRHQPRNCLETRERLARFPLSLLLICASNCDEIVSGSRRLWFFAFLSPYLQ